MIARAGSVIVDTHVHLHPRFDPGVFLDAAAANASADAVLCFTESASVNRFAELRDARRAGAWSIDPTGEPEALRARRGDRAITLLAGRQVVTAERIEVLALATIQAIPDGQPLGVTIDATRGAGAIPVIPWGFGKWWGARGRLIGETIRAREDVLLGDQAGRPRGVPEQRLFRIARERSIPALPGSDPLDLARHVRRPACLGFTLDTSLDERCPAADLRARIGALRESPPVVGRRVGMAAFVRDQAALRMVRRRGGAG